MTKVIMGSHFYKRMVEIFIIYNMYMFFLNVSLARINCYSNMDGDHNILPHSGVAEVYTILGYRYILGVLLFLSAPGFKSGLLA